MSIAHVFNGFKDLKLKYDGKWFRFPYNEITKVGDQKFWAPDERARNHESAPNPNAILQKDIEAIPFTNDLLNRHYLGLQAEGVVWVGDRMPTDAEKKATMESGRIKKMKMVEVALADRRSAIGKGGQPELDKDIVLWMQEFNIHDDLYNKKAEGMSDEELERIGAIAGAVVAKMQQSQPAGVKK